MDKRDGITVCVAAHPQRFRNDLLSQALASVLAQTLQPAAILVFNDTERKGAGWSRQNLLAQVSTRWTAWLDSDDLWDPDHLEKLHRVAEETGSVYVFSYFKAASDPLGHFGRPFDPCNPHHTTMNVLVDTALAQEVGFPDNESGRFANEDWSFIQGVCKLACERGLKVTHLAERTWTWRHHGGNSSGQPFQGDAIQA